MKKFFEQPALEVVRINNSDIVATSGPGMGDPLDPNQNYEAGAPGQRGVFDPYNAGY